MQGVRLQGKLNRLRLNTKGLKLNTKKLREKLRLNMKRHKPSKPNNWLPLLKSKVAM